MRITKEHIESFSSIVTYDVSSFLQQYIQFIQNDKINIINYYSGIDKNPQERSFKKLSYLITQMKILTESIELNKTRMTSTFLFEVYELLCDIDSSLQTTDNASKWLRSSIVKNDFNPQVQQDYTTGVYETLESVSSNVLNSTDRDQYWMTIALRNDLIEEDYTPNGGTVIQVTLQNNTSIALTSVVDNTFGERVCGIDIQRVIEFRDDDLVALSYKETVLQAIGILSSLTQGHNPEFPTHGIQRGVVVGSNESQINYPSLFRQMYNNFKRDDTLRAITIKKVTKLPQVLSINFTVETRLGEVEEQQVLI